MYMCVCFPSPLKILQINGFYNFRFYGPTYCKPYKNDVHTARQYGRLFLHLVQHYGTCKEYLIHRFFFFYIVATYVEFYIYLILINTMDINWCLYVILFTFKTMYLKFF